MALFSNTLAVIRQYVSTLVGDAIIGTADSGSVNTIVHGMLRGADDYYLDHKYRAYIYNGPGIGEEREVSDSTVSNTTLVFTPVFSNAITNVSQYELHYKFTSDDFLTAINMAIASLANTYLVPLIDETTISLTSTTDNLGNVVHTFEYALPATMVYLHRIITEEKVSGKKLTGTVSGTFVAGETVTGGTSGAKGEFTYQGTTYIRVRKVSGSFAVGENTSGSTASCNTLTAVANEIAGGGRWLDQDEIDPRSWSIVKTYPSGTPELLIDKRYYSVDEDLYLRLEGQRSQPALTADTDACYLPLDWIVQKAITCLPHSKIQSNELTETYRQAMVMSSKEPRNYPHPRAVQVVE